MEPWFPREEPVLPAATATSMVLPCGTVWRGARAPFRVFGNAARREASPPHRRPLGIRCSFRVLSPPKYRGRLVPQSRFAVGRFPGCAVFPRWTARATVKQPVHPLCEFRVPPESCPAFPSRPTAVRQLLSWAFVSLQHTRDRRSTAAGFAAPRYVPPSGFGDPLGGLLPPSPCRFSFTPAALMGLRPSEPSPLGRYPPRFRAEGPTCRFSRRFSRRRSGRPAQRAAASGFQPCRESLATDTG
jgi:hypothetical protein